MLHWLETAHIVVLGYWLGAELVINATYRLVCYDDRMPFAHRDRLMDHVMKVDQHVRYALVLQAMLGTMLAALYGYLPGGPVVVKAAAVVGLVWLVFVEIVHRLRKAPVGATLGRLDRASRYVLLGLIVATAMGAFGWPLPLWLRWKLAAFGSVIACGVGIRIALGVHFATWRRMRQNGATARDEQIIRRTYVKATSVLVLLWSFIGLATFLSVAKPFS